MDAMRPDEEIIAELVELGRTDTTDPPNWALDLQLRELEGETLQKGDEARFERICQEVRFRSDDPHVRGLFLLGALNGIRRPGSERLHEVGAVVNTAQATFAELPAGPKKTRLVGFLNYQVAIFAGQTGDYRLASETQLLAAIEEEGNDNMTGAAICRFMAAYEAVNQAVIDGAVNDFKGLLEDLIESGHIILEVFDEEDEPSPEATRWLGFNAPVHRTMAHFWSDQNSWPTQEMDREILEELIESQFSLVKVNLGGYYAALAIHALMERDLLKAHGFASAALASLQKTAAEYLITAGLVLAAISIEINDGDLKDSADEVLRSLINLDKPGGHQARAVARQWLEKLEKGENPTV